jgi:hypothetical protein
LHENILLPSTEPPRTFKELKNVKKANVSINFLILQAVIEKLKKDFDIAIDLSDRRKKGKMYKVKIKRKQIYRTKNHF